MADLLAEADAFFESIADQLPQGTDWGTAIPTGIRDLPVVAGQDAGLYAQYAWDGTPDEDNNRETGAWRITVWGPPSRARDCRDTAALAKDLAVAYSSSQLWRVSRGTGRLPGVDPDSGLPFCTVTVNAVLHALTL